MTSLLVCAPLALEERALRRGLEGTGARVVRTGMGVARSARSATALSQDDDGAPLVIAGVCGALDPRLRPGDVVVATEVRHGPTALRCPSAALLAGELRRAGLTVHTGPIATIPSPPGKAARAQLAAEGTLAVDMESAILLAALSTPSRGWVVVRVVVDTPGRPLVGPWTLPGGIRALRVLRRTGGALAAWGAAVRPRQVLLAAPRSFCAGVERAIRIVELTLEQHGAPVYVRKQIVHNRHVVSDLERRGAIFVDELDQVPAGATVVFSAHGVAPAVRADAERRGLNVIDATCPLVAKVHAETRRFAGRGDHVLLIGHAGHEEVEGTLGEAPGSITLVETVEDVARLDPPDPERVAYLMQTTLSADEAEEIASAIKARFPAARGPGSDDICYATTNRQRAVRAIAEDADLVLVVGSGNSSNSLRLVEVARRAGTRAELVDDPAGIELGWLAGAGVVGLTAGASAPPALVGEVADALAGLGGIEVAEREVATETISFTLPKGVRS